MKRQPIFKNHDERVIAGVMRAIGEEAFREKCAAAGVNPPLRMVSFHLEYKGERFELYWQHGPRKLLIMDVTEIIGLTQNWSLLMKTP